MFCDTKEVSFRGAKWISSIHSINFSKTPSPGHSPGHFPTSHKTNQGVGPSSWTISHGWCLRLTFVVNKKLELFWPIDSGSEYILGGSQPSP